MLGYTYRLCKTCIFVCRMGGNLSLLVRTQPTQRRCEIMLLVFKKPTHQQQQHSRRQGSRRGKTCRTPCNLRQILIELTPRPSGTTPNTCSHLARARTERPVSLAVKSTKPVSGVMLRKRGSNRRAFSTCVTHIKGSPRTRQGAPQSFQQTLRRTHALCDGLDVVRRRRGRDNIFNHAQTNRRDKLSRQFPLTYHRK